MKNHSTTLFYFQSVAEFFRMGYAENRTRAAAGPHGGKEKPPGKDTGPWWTKTGYLNNELSKYRSNVVLIYGDGSIKKNVIYDEGIEIAR